MSPSHADPDGGLAEEQAALRRVATLVASVPAPERVFHAVAEEAGRLLGGKTAACVRFAEQGGVVVGCWDEGGDPSIQLGTFVPYSDPEGPVHRASHHGGRVDDYTDVPGEAARMTRESGYLSSVAAPVVAAGRTWGALFVFSSRPRHFASGAERRLAHFSELVGLALESVEAYDQLRASRTRIVEAGLRERRRLERNLHDGAQQRLVSTSLTLRLAIAQLWDAPRKDVHDLLVEATSELSQALEELRDLARGLHPAILSERGLAPALNALAERAPLPVELTNEIDGRLPAEVEAALYYVVAESLTNVAKYAQATQVTVHASCNEGIARIEVADDGTGGAEVGSGSGLRGLADRIEALGGGFGLSSIPGEGTRVWAEIPVDADSHADRPG